MKLSCSIRNILLICIVMSFASGTFYGYAKSRIKRSKKYQTTNVLTNKTITSASNTNLSTIKIRHHTKNTQYNDIVPIIDKSVKTTNTQSPAQISQSFNYNNNSSISKIHQQSLAISICWPIKNPNSKTSPLKNFNFDDCIQPTESGILESGKFGMVRNNSTRFHKGLDIKSFIKDKKNIAADSVYAFSSGKVVYINNTAGNSNFGKYIVIDHELFLTLYAHLSEVYVTVGQNVTTADKIGKIGTTSNNANIPNSRAHVHFEIDFLCGNELNFSNWYTKNYGSNDKNLHGQYNGLNLFGVDTIKVATNIAKNVGLSHLFDDEPTAVTMFIKTNIIPDFVKKYQSIVAAGIDINKPVAGWQIEWTWYGFPKKWTPVYFLSERDTKIVTKIISYSSSLLDISKRRGILSQQNNILNLGKVINDSINKLGLK